MTCKIVYISVFCNTSFSWLFPLDGFQFIFFVPYLLGDSKTGSIQGSSRPQGLLAFQYGKREDPGDEVGASALFGIGVKKKRREELGSGEGR